jgi:hypothetical protein
MQPRRGLGDGVGPGHAEGIEALGARPLGKRLLDRARI